MLTVAASPGNRARGGGASANRYALQRTEDVENKNTKLNRRLRLRATEGDWGAQAAKRRGQLVLCAADFRFGLLQLWRTLRFRFRMLTITFLRSRLVTRAKESSLHASIWAETPNAQ